MDISCLDSEISAGKENICEFQPVVTFRNISWIQLFLSPHLFSMAIRIHRFHKISKPLGFWSYYKEKRLAWESMSWGKDLQKFMLPSGFFFLVLFYFPEGNKHAIPARKTRKNKEFRNRMPIANHQSMSFQRWFAAVKRIIMAPQRRKIGASFVTCWD